LEGKYAGGAIGRKAKNFRGDFDIFVLHLCLSFPVSQNNKKSADKIVAEHNRTESFMENKGRMKTEDIILGKARYEDWRSMTHGWSMKEAVGRLSVLPEWRK